MTRLLRRITREKAAPSSNGGRTAGACGDAVRDRF